MKTETFRGINNVSESTALKPGEFSAATNVIIGTSGKLSTRPARTLVATGTAASPRRWLGQVIALLDSDLVAMSEAGAVQRVVYPSLGYTRVWYAQLPDGRLAFSNGLINGLVSPGGVAVAWGVPTPVDAGFGVAGGTRYHVTYVRSSDGLEGPPTYSTDLIDPATSIVGLPQLAGHTINVYFAPYGEAAFYAGSTPSDTFLKPAGELGAQFIGSGLGAPSVGTQLTVWRSRVLIADGSVLWATKPLQPELCDLTQDFVQMPAPITLLYGADNGIFVGTTQATYFLTGDTFGQLALRMIAPGPATLGSIVEIDASGLSDKVRPEGVLRVGVCIINGSICMLAGGSVVPLTSSAYRRTMTEVYATARLYGGHLQYLAASV